MRLVRYRGAWYATWTEDGQTVRRALRTKDKAEAQARLHDLQRQPVGDTVGEIMAAYLDDLDARAARPDRQHTAWKALDPHFGALYPEQVDRATCRLYAKRRAAQGRSRGTVATELRALRAGLRWHDPRTPAVVEIPSTPPPRERFLTPDEYEALVAGCEDHHVRLFVILAYATAGRAKAILDLTWDRVDFDRGLIRLATGGPGERRKGRATVPMTERARKALLEAREIGASEHVIEWGGRQVRSVRKGFATACRNAGLVGVTPHTLRRTAAVRMAEAGVPMVEVAQFLGHDDARTTERIYARFSPNYLRKAAKALE